MQKSVVWKAIADDTEEFCNVNYLDTGIVIRSEITGWVDGAAVTAEYVIRLDNSWQVMDFDITFQISDTSHHYSMSKNASAIWEDNNGVEYPQFSECKYIDITLTPFTNSLPINGLEFKEGETIGIDVLYIDVMANDIRKDCQHYTKLKEHRYFFENDDGNFSAEIETDSTGFVTHYPHLFNMIKPK